MKTANERKKDSIERLKILKDATIARYSESIEYNEPLDLYDVMMEHFSRGDLDDVFLTDVTSGMNDEEIEELFSLVREYQGLCFAHDDVDYWLDSVENTYVTDFEMISCRIFDCFNYLLELTKLAKDSKIDSMGGRSVLQQLVALREDEELRDVAIIEYLRDTFIDDRVLANILLDMSEENSLYDMFSDEQKGILLTYPEGTLYSYSNGKISITSPLILGAKMYNDFHEDIADNLIGEITDDNLDDSVNLMSGLFSDDNYDFYGSVLDLSNRYRDYFRQSKAILDDEEMSIVYDDDGSIIQDAWDGGDSFLGGSFDTPHGK